MGTLAVPDDVVLLAPREDGESDQEYEMFAYFVSLPVSRRTARAVAAKFGVAQRDVLRVAMQRNWLQRAREHDLNVILSLRSQLASELMEFVGSLVDLGRAVTGRLLEALPNLEFHPSHVDRLVSSLANLASAVFALTGGSQQQQQPVSSVASVQNIVLMHLQNASRDAFSVGISQVAAQPDGVD